MQKMMDCNIIEEIKGKQNKLHVVFATFCRTEVKVIGTWKKQTNSKFNFNNVFSANSTSRTRQISYSLFIKFGYTILKQIIIYSLRYV